MKQRNLTYHTLKACGKIFSIAIMLGCLILLTGGNFLVYDSGHRVEKTDQKRTSKTAPTPAEEKTSGNSLTVQEEYIHNHHSFGDFIWLDNLLTHRILEAEKLAIVHYELISPPPRHS